MIKSIALTNFQAHKKTSIKLSAGVNIFAGTSDAGKSSIIRAITWALTNKPQGLEFRRWDCKKGEEVKTELVFDDGMITRLRSESSNAYLANDAQLVAMRSDVPQEIQDITKLSDINIQGQFAAHFLLSASSGEVARTLNAACDFTIIDTTLKKINGLASNATSDAKAAQAQADELEQEAQELAWVYEADARLRPLLEESKKIAQKESDVMALSKIIDALVIIDDKLATSRDTCAKLAPSLDLMQEAIDITQQDKELGSLSAILERIMQIEQAPKNPNIIFSQLPAINEQAATLQKLLQDKARLSDLLTKLDGFDIAHSLAFDNVKATKQDLDEFCSSFDICPLCKQEVSHA